MRVHVRACGVCGVELTVNCYRPDEKTAREQNITAGAVLHLVLALRGGMI